MSRLVVAREDQIDEVYRESHALWGAGLDLPSYRALWHELSGTAWARRWVRFLVWVDGAERILSSMKTYRPQLRLGGRLGRATVLGAVFTPERVRGRGHGSAMVRAALDEARRRGDVAVLLFSDIGTGYYRGFGFRELAAHEQWGRLPASLRPPAGWSLRPWELADLPEVEAAHEAFCRRRPLAIVRDSEHWEFIRTRAEGFFSRMRGAGLHHRVRIALRDGRFAGYLISIEGRGEWNLREIGAAGGDPETMTGVLRLGAAAAVASGLRRFYGWLPPELPRRVGDWRIRTRRRARALPMLLPLAAEADAGGLPLPAGASYLPFQDQF